MNDLSKEEVLKIKGLFIKKWSVWWVLNPNKYKLNRAFEIDLDEYTDQQAKKEAIGFYNFCQNQILIRKTYESFNEWAKANDEEKYNLYIQSKQQIKSYE